jgi:uncharacterized glyoxalase superfamily protein PhnB
MVHSTPEGYRTVTPYLVVSGAGRLLEFVSRVFDAELMDRSTHPDGTIWHACVRIGDSTLMVSEATERFPASST